MSEVPPNGFLGENSRIYDRRAACVLYFGFAGARTGERIRYAICDGNATRVVTVFLNVFRTEKRELDGAFYANNVYGKKPYNNIYIYILKRSSPGLARIKGINEQNKKPSFVRAFSGRNTLKKSRRTVIG